VRLPFYDQDGDTLPRWWEQTYGLSDANAGDAAGDLDGDGMSNADEYAHHSRPDAADSDGDGLSDLQEIVTYATDPIRVDSDGDGLDDHAEVITYHTDPRDTDSDNDSYTDLDEVLYGGNPVDSSLLPQPMTSYSQGFEGGALPAAWSQAPQGNAPWAPDPTSLHAGAAGMKSGTISHSQYSGIRFRGFFSTGTLKFWARVDAEGCCDRLNVLVNGVSALSVASNGGWTQYSVPVTLGIRDIEWRYQKDSTVTSGADAAWIDDVTFSVP